jgi:hypothetical protein
MVLNYIKIPVYQSVFTLNLYDGTEQRSNHEHLNGMSLATHFLTDNDSPLSREVLPGALDRGKNVEDGRKAPAKDELEED